MPPWRLSTARIDRMAVRGISDTAAILLNAWFTPALMAIEQDQDLALCPTDSVLPRSVVG
jgi:hypothetical protein